MIFARFRSLLSSLCIAAGLKLKCVTRNEGNMAARFCMAFAKRFFIVLFFINPSLPSQGSEGYKPDVYRESTEAFKLLSERSPSIDWVAKQTGAELAWQESYILLSYVTMYEAFRDIAYLDKAMERIDQVFKVRADRTATRDLIRERVLCAWNSTRYTQGQSYAWLVHAGMITYPAARAAYLIRQDPGMEEKYVAKARDYIRYIEEVIHAFDSSWREDNEKNEGWYYEDYLKHGAPFNMQNAMGRTLIALWLATGKDEHRLRAEKLANFFKNRLKLVENRYEWSYEARGGNAEDISHAAIDVGFAFDAYRAGLVFTRSDMTRFVHVFEKCTDGDAGFTKYIDGKGDLTNSAAMGGWGQLGYIEPKLRHTLYKYYVKHWHVDPFTGILAASYLAATRIGQEDFPVLDKY